MDKPAILITPKDCQVESDNIQALSKAIYEAQPGQVISAAFPIELHHFIDGLWIKSSDLPKVLTKVQDDVEFE